MREWLFLAAVFMMVTGDFPRFPFGIQEKHLPFLILSWPKLYVFLLAFAFVLLILTQGIRFQETADTKLLKQSFLMLLFGFSGSCLFSQDKRMSLEALGSFCAILLFLYLFALSLQSETNIERMEFCLLFAAVFLAVRVILWRIHEGLDVGTYHLKNNSWIGKLQITWVLNFFSPIFLATALKHPEFKKRLYFGMAWMVVGLGILVLYSRAGWFSFLVTTLLVPWMNHLKWEKWGLVIGSLLILLFVITAQSRFGIQYVVMNSAEFQAQGGVQTRWGIWKDTIKMFLDHPLTGIGLGTYDKIAYTDYHNFHDRTHGEGRNGFYLNGWHAHNVSLHLLAETGLFGFFAWGCLWYTLFRSLRAKWKDPMYFLARPEISACSCFLFSFLILSMTENLMAIRVYESMRMNLTIGFLLVYNFLKVRPHLTVLPLPEGNAVSQTET